MSFRISGNIYLTVGLHLDCINNKVVRGSQIKFRKATTDQPKCQKYLAACSGAFSQISSFYPISVGLKSGLICS